MTKIKQFKSLTHTEIELFREFLEVEIPTFAKDEEPYGLNLMELYAILWNYGVILDDQPIELKGYLFDKEIFDSLLMLVMERKEVEEVKFLSLMFSVLLILFRLFKSEK